jgi:hypothetical protein
MESRSLYGFLSFFMKKYLHLILILAAVCAISCKAMLIKKYGLNKKKNFANREEYINFLTEKKKFPLSNMLFPDSSSYLPFITSLVEKHLSVYYGSFLNDSTELVKSDELQKNLSCMGRILTDMNNGLSNMQTLNDSLIKRTDLKDYRFLSISTNELYKMNDSKKRLKIFLAYSYGLGSYFDSFYKATLDFAAKHKDEVELKIILMDQMYVPRQNNIDEY